MKTNGTVDSSSLSRLFRTPAYARFDGTAIISHNIIHKHQVSLKPFVVHCTRATTVLDYNTLGMF